jgi:hypothetical protein
MSLSKVIGDFIDQGYPESVAERVASGQLPMDQASRMDRARDLGFDTNNLQYHGTSSQFESFTPSSVGNLGPGVYTTPDPNYASGRAMSARFKALKGSKANAEQNVLPVLTRSENPLEVYGSPLNVDVDHVRSQGFDSIIRRDSPTDNVVEQNIFDPQNVRSQYAAFDPEYKGSNILGFQSGQKNPSIAGSVANSAVGAASAAAPSNSEAESYEGLTDNMVNYLTEQMGGTDEARKKAEWISFGMDFTPFLGAAKGVSETYDAYRNDDKLGMALGAAGTLAGIVPFGRGAFDAGVNYMTKGSKPVMREGERVLEDVQPSTVYDSRKKMQPVMENLTLDVKRSQYDKPVLSLADLYGQKALLTMSDRTPSGDTLYGVNDFEFDVPVNLDGGQNYMFNTRDFPNQVFANARGYTTAVQNVMEQEGLDSMALLPFQMAPSSNDFPIMGPSVMIEHAKQALSKKDIAYINKLIREKDPTWVGIENADTREFLTNATGPQRKNILTAFDNVNDPTPAMRKAGMRHIPGALSLTETRLAISAPSQILTPTNLNVNNVGLLLRGVEPSPHTTYSTALLGEGVGVLDTNHTFRDFIPELLTHPRTNANYVDSTDQYKARLGIQTVDINDELLKRLGY